MKTNFLLFFILITCYTIHAQNTYTIKQPGAIPLHGTWSFALDPAAVGESEKWYRDLVSLKNWDLVDVPHCFSVDPRYKYFTGNVWYRRSFAWKPVVGKRVILHFDGAYYKTTVWLNNVKIDTHEGGYTPFQMDITEQLKAGDNYIAINIDNNTWKRGTIPGPKDEYVSEDKAVHGQFPGWMNYGGIIRPIYLTVEPEVYLKNVKVETTLNAVKKTAQLRARFFIRSKNNIAPQIPDITVNQADRAIALKWKFNKPVATGEQMFQIDAEASLKSTDIKLWNLDDPNLYKLRAVLSDDTLSTTFGIRQVKVKDAKFFVNGESVRLGGANRVIDYPGLGSMEPDWLIEKDMKLMKEAGMEFHRLTHYTTSEAVLDWADKNGMFIIIEAGNWQLTEKQMDNDTIRTKFKKQFTEMVERDWNHPSVIAYSVGNEYLSDRAAGQRWTKDMIEFGRKELDTTRLYTFASMMLNSRPKTGADEASQYCDFVSANIYGGHSGTLDHIHKMYPDKPILISEYGTRADNQGGEEGQIAYLKKFMSDIRQRPYVVGASWWSYNDYESLHAQTNKNGYRWWGLVKPDRTPRLVYALHQTEMSPIMIERKKMEAGTLTITLTNRSDFPSYTVKRYIVKARDFEKVIPDLLPGQQFDVVIPVSGSDTSVSVEVKKPTGFTIVKRVIELR